MNEQEKRIAEQLLSKISSETDCNMIEVLVRSYDMFIKAVALRMTFAIEAINN